MHARVCFGCSVTTPGSRATYTRAHTDAHARATHMRVYTRARSRRSFAITYHYSAWLLELQPRAMFATRLPCAILLLLLVVLLSLSLSFSLFLALSFSHLFLYHARVSLGPLPPPRLLVVAFPFPPFLRVLPFHLALTPLPHSPSLIIRRSRPSPLRLALSGNTFLTY